jgi:hypothetical protein
MRLPVQPPASSGCSGINQVCTSCSILRSRLRFSDVLHVHIGVNVSEHHSKKVDSLVIPSVTSSELHKSVPREALPCVYACPRDPALSPADNRRLLRLSTRAASPSQSPQHNTAYSYTQPIPTSTKSVDRTQTARMSGSAQGSADTKKAVISDAKNGEQPLNAEKKPAAQLEEDDEFEDFPVEGTHHPKKGHSRRMYGREKI